MAGRRILIIQGHPDPRPVHYGHALADAYASEARSHGHEVRRVDVATLDFPLLRAMSDWDAPLPAALAPAQEGIRWAEHLVLVFPLWLGTMPALLQGFLEQVLRPGFASVSREGDRTKQRKGLSGKSARLIVTMGMPAFVYRWYYLAHGVKGLERNVLKLCGIEPVRETFIGMVEQGEKRRRRALERVRELGRTGR
jgi:putative NADPH-quinone reductase